MIDKNLILENAARALERIAMCIRERDIESFGDLTHDIMDGAYCSFSQICVNVDLCEVREILDRGDV